MTTLVRELAGIAGAANVEAPVPRAALRDATEAQAYAGRADALVLPGERRGGRRAARLVLRARRPDHRPRRRLGLRRRRRAARAGSSARSSACTPSARSSPRGGACTPRRGSRPRTCIASRARTASGSRPIPGAAEQSQLGGNIATNAGGPHAFKYGVTGDWVMGLEAVVAPGEVVRVGGALRKDVAGYDLRGLLIGSEGTLGIVTAAWLRLIPAPEAALPVVGFYADAAAGCAAVQNALASGAIPAALEFLDAGALAAAAGLPGTAARPARASPCSPRPTARSRARGRSARRSPRRSRTARSPCTPREPDALWRWRYGVSHRGDAQRGGKLSEDVAVPVERLAEAVEGTVAIGARHGLAACSWGHAGDGNVHADLPARPGRRRRARRGGGRGRGALRPRASRSAGRCRASTGSAGSRPTGSPISSPGALALQRASRRARPEGPAQPRRQAARDAGGVAPPASRIVTTASSRARRGSAPRTARPSASRSPSSRPNRPGRVTRDGADRHRLPSPL